ncbi:MAG: Holliday junction resolvase-like protein, partial [Nitrososphaerales archaeon]
VQRAQLEQSIREAYSAQFGQWKVTELAQTVQNERLDALEKSRSVLKGKIGEQLAPLLPEFLSLYNPSEARFLGSPIDYVVFKNLSSEGEYPLEIVLVDVKTGNSTLSKNERRIEEAITSGRVSFHTLRLDASFEGKESTLPGFARKS